MKTNGSSTAQLSVVIPVLNEEDIVEQNLRTLANFLDDVIGRGVWAFVVVDNGSTDKTPEILTRVLADYPPSLTIHEKEPNYGRALRTGLENSHTKFVHICDIEQWDLPFLAWAWRYRDDHDLFIGSKRSDPTVSKQHPRRRFLSWGLNALLQLLFGYMGTETHGPKLINMDRIRPILAVVKSERGQFDTEIVLRTVRKGYRIAEAPIAFKEERPPRRKLIKKIVWNLVAFNRLRGFIKDVPYEGDVEFRQFARSDVLRASAARVPASAGTATAADTAAASPH
jgi:glycosyltransferase involved in cell wall biosynthesis